MESPHSPETRWNLLTNQWIAYAPERSDRPRRTSTDNAAPSLDNDRPVEGCPFCPGHEDMLPTVLWQLDGGAGAWRTRAVPNKFSALTSHPPPDSPPPSPLYKSRPSVGRQEVLIETPFHHRAPHHFAPAEMDALLHTYLKRYREARGAGLYPFLFRNHGASAGASIDHPHSQLIASAFKPVDIQQEEARAKTYYDEHGRCPYCALIEAESQAEERLVATTDTWVAFVPYAAKVPYEVWLLPRSHNPEFGRTSPDERSALAEMLVDILSRLHNGVDNPAYNLFVRTALSHETEAPHLHWSVRIQPRISVDAGFERSTGVQINPSIPERDAAVLRAA